MGKHNRVRSLIDELPAAERLRVDEMLADVRYTYQDISEALSEVGYEISKSSIGRYAARSSKAANRLKEMRERTDALIKAVKEGQDIQSGEVAVQMLIDRKSTRLNSSH